MSSKKRPYDKDRAQSSIGSQDKVYGKEIQPMHQHIGERVPAGTFQRLPASALLRSGFRN